MDARFFDVAQDMLCIAINEGRFIRVNDAWTRTLGWSAEELCSRPYSEFVHPDDRERTDVETSQIVGGVPTMLFRNRYRHKDGGYHWIDWRASVDPETGEIYASARDVTKEMLLHQELAAREELLTTMVAEQLRAREDEHRRIANDLHDSAMQHSVAALMFLDMVPLEDPAVREPVELVRAEVDQTLRTTREVMQGLDPLDLGEQTLQAAVRDIASNKQVRFGIPVEVSADHLDDDIEGPGAAALCRMVHETLTNAAKHAEATCVQVSLGSDRTEVWAAVRDDGRGMTSASRDDTERSGAGLGLAFLKERASSLGGHLHVTSSTGGTTVRMTLPRHPAVRSSAAPLEADASASRAPDA